MARQRKQTRVDYDSPWKEFLTVFFEAFIRTVLPELHTLIDWERAPEFLDNELRRLSPRSETGRLYTDRLVTVWLKDGDARAILVHIEAQSQPVAEFEQRVFAYYARIWLELRLDIVCIAVLADKSPTWRPSRYVRELPGTRLDFQFHPVKLTDIDEAFLQAQARARNPAALMLLAFRKAIGTEADVEARFAARQQLTRLTFEFGYHEDDRAQILRLLEWVTKLPEVLEQRIEELVEEYKRERGTTFVSRLERRAIEQGCAEGFVKGRAEGRAEGFAEGRAEGFAEGHAEGRTEGLRQAIKQIAMHRFGAMPEALQPLLERITNPETLEELISVALSAPTAEALMQQIEQRAVQEPNEA
ncbi:MAG: hypothetical protein NZ550_00235 [Fimbriimonadales bacterium]|nr:hypothetical protein [Fimbriimonadales bacterium]